MTLQRKMAHGALWSLVEKLGNQGVSLFVFMVVARLIGPKEYGIANVCFVFSSIVNIIILCLADGIVCLKIRDTKCLSTLFWCIIGVGCGLTLLTITGAGKIADWMGEPRLKAILQLFSLVFIFMAASVVPVKLLYSDLKFRVFAYRALLASTLSGMIGVTFAFQGFGAYAIVFQQIALYAIMTIVVWYFAQWRPAFFFDARLLKNSLSPGFKLMSSDVFGVLEEEVPRFLIAGILGPTLLGYYGFATRIRFALRDIFINPLNAVLCPSLTQVDGDRSSQAHILGHVLALIGIVIFPILALGAYTAPIYVPLLFGEAWRSAVPVLQVFIYGSAVFPVQMVMRELLRASNQLALYLRFQLPLLIISLIITILLVPHGIMAVSIGSVCWNILVIPLYIYMFSRWTGIELWLPVARLVKSFAGIVVMLSAISFYQHSAICPSQAWLKLFSLIGVGGAVYVVICLIIHPRQMVAIIKFGTVLISREALPDLGGAGG